MTLTEKRKRIAISLFPAPLRNTTPGEDLAFELARELLQHASARDINAAARRVIARSKTPLPAVMWKHWAAKR